MSAPAAIRALELDRTPEDELRQLHGAVATALGAPLPGEEPSPFEGWLADERRLDSFLEMVRFAAFDDGTGQPVGYGRVELDRDANTHVGWVSVVVAEGRRRRGVGSALLRALVDVAADDGRVSIGANADEGSPGEAFLGGLGLSRRNVAHQSRLPMDAVDVAMLDEWVGRAAERASGYSLRGWDGPTPDEVVEDFAVAHDVMNSAPRGDLDLADERMTPDRLRAVEAGRARAVTTWWTLCAVEDATGALAGFTQLSFPRFRPTVARQNDTGVEPAHRERGLGRWLKAAMLLRVLEEKPEVEQVETWNAGSNAPMLAINHALGFRLARVSANWQGDLDVVRKGLEARS